MTKKDSVIIVEDEAIIAMDMKNTIEGLGYNVSKTFSSGEEAISYLDEFEVDLILMDIKIAGKMDGIETAEEINKKHNIPIIYITSYSDEKTLERAMDTRPYSYLIKPIEERDLAIEIRLTLRNHKMELRLINTYMNLQKLYDKIEILNGIKDMAVEDIINNVLSLTENVCDTMDHGKNVKDDKELPDAKEILRNKIMLLENLRDNLKIDEGKIAISPSVFNLNDLASIVIDDVHSKAEEIGVEITSVDEIVTVKADYYKIKYVITFLLNYLLDLAGKNGKLDIHIKKDKDAIKFSIFDAKNTIPPESFDNIFTDPAKNNDLHGRSALIEEDQPKSIGLVGIKDLISAHNGSIGTENTINDGISLFFTLPVVDDDIPSEDRYGSKIGMDSFIDKVPYT